MALIVDQERDRRQREQMSSRQGRNQQGPTQGRTNSGSASGGSAGGSDVNRPTSQADLDYNSLPREQLREIYSRRNDLSKYERKHMEFDRADDDYIYYRYTGPRHTVGNTINEELWDGKKIERDQAYEETFQLGNALDDAAKDYRENMDENYADLSRPLYDTARDSIEGGVDRIRDSANRRGLLYSGMREAAEGDLKSQVASQLAQSSSALWGDLEDTARAKEEVAAQYGLDQYRQAVAHEEEVYQMQMENALARRKALSQLGEAVGYGFGSYLGGQSEPGSQSSNISLGSQFDQAYPGYRRGLLGVNTNLEE